MPPISLIRTSTGHPVKKLDPSFSDVVPDSVTVVIVVGEDYASTLTA